VPLAPVVHIHVGYDKFTPSDKRADGENTVFVTNNIEGQLRAPCSKAGAQQQMHVDSGPRRLNAESFISAFVMLIFYESVKFISDKQAIKQQ